MADIPISMRVSQLQIFINNDSVKITEVVET